MCTRFFAPGLGKTAQMCTHFGSLALLHNENRGHDRQSSSIFIVVCPATVLHHWLQEFHHWAPFMRTVILHGISATASELLKLGNESELMGNCAYSLLQALT
jgi:SNF2 family DNA or RNA helicase